MIVGLITGLILGFAVGWYLLIELRRIIREEFGLLFRRFFEGE